MSESIPLTVARLEHSKAWGDSYVTERTDASVPPFALAQDFPRLPGHIHAAWVQLALATCDGSAKSVDAGSEVGIVLARDAATLRQWRAFCPRQSVGGAHVALRMDALCDLLTGEAFDGLPEGWLHAGTSHSHNTMPAFFSSTDNEDELPLPGLHYVLGKLDGPTYAWAASIVRHRQRYILDDIRSVVDVEGSGTFHPSCLDYISRESRISLVGFAEPAFSGMVTHGDGDDDVDWLAICERWQRDDVRLDDTREQAIAAARSHAGTLHDKRMRRAILHLCDAIEGIDIDDDTTRDVLWRLMLETLDDGDC